MSNPAIFIGEPLNFKNKIKIYPPTVRDIVTNDFYGQFVKILTFSQDEILEEFLNQKDKKMPTPFEFLLINCYHSREFFYMTQAAFEFFIHEKISISYQHKVIIFGEEISKEIAIEELHGMRRLEESEFFDFQNAIREACGNPKLKQEEPPNPNEDPRITEMKAKARRRDRIKAKQGAKNGISLQTTLVAICCMGIGITPLNIGEMSYAAIGPIMSMLQDKEKYDIDIKSLLAGADSKKIKPKYWIRNSDKD